MYSDQILDHFHHPRNVGEITSATAWVEMTNPVCGDLMQLWVLLRDGKVAEARFKMQGCIPAVACGSWLTEAMRGKTPAELAGVSAEEIEAALGGLPPASRHAARLAADALKVLFEKLS